MNNHNSAPENVQSIFDRELHWQSKNESARAKPSTRYENKLCGAISAIEEGCQMQDKIAELRQLKKDSFKLDKDSAEGSENKKKRDEIKKTLPVISLYQFANNWRKTENFKAGSDLVCIDLDDLSPMTEQLELYTTASHVRDLMALYDACICAFVSPSGFGVKAIFYVPTFNNKEELEHAYEYIKAFVRKEHGLVTDDNASKLTSTINLSYDADIYSNILPTKLNIPPAPIKPKRQAVVRSSVSLESGDYKQSYIESAIRGEMDDLSTSESGTHNDTLYKSSVAIFSILAGAKAGSGKMHSIELELLSIAQDIGQETKRAQDTIKNARKKGESSPRMDLPKTVSQPLKKNHEINGFKGINTMDNKTSNVVPINSGVTIDNETREIINKKIHWNTTFKKKNIEGKIVEKPMPTIENLEILMKHYNVFVTYDELLLKTDIKGINSLKGNEANSLIAFMKNKCVDHGLSKCVVDEQLDIICEKYVINPVVYWLKSAKRISDNNPIDALVELLPVDNKPWVKIAFRRWLIQCCAAADMGRQSPNEEAIAKYESVLVFSGEQGIKKTSFIKYLLPKSLQAYKKEGILLDVKDKDSMLTVLRGWIPELGELDSTFKRSDISALKAFLSNTVDEIRLPYARKPVIITRHVSCFGTVNDEQYLRDATGNRRYLPVKVIGSLDIMVKENFDIEDLWAYVWGEYKRGEQWWLTKDEEVIQKEVLSHHEDKTLEDLLLDIFNFDTPKTKGMTGAEVLRAISQPNSRSTIIKLGNALKSLGVEKSKNREYPMPRLRSMDDSFIDF